MTFSTALVLNNLYHHTGKTPQGHRGLKIARTILIQASLFIAACPQATGEQIEGRIAQFLVERKSDTDFVRYWTDEEYRKEKNHKDLERYYKTRKHKFCKQCGQYRPLKAFGISKHTKGTRTYSYLLSKCKRCMAANQAERSKK